jgi:hypothetical protein
VQFETFDARFADAVERSFRDDAIRTAVLIDDQFPDYAGMREATDQEFKEIPRARAIYTFMHSKGLICDVQNWRVRETADLRLLDKIRKSDLILLDYQLGAAGTKAALEILRHLAVSSHFNLVVLYTAEASPRVALAVAAAMRGLKPAEAALTPSQAVCDEAEDILSEERFKISNTAELHAYLTEGKAPWKKDLSEALKQANLDRRNVKALADLVARRWIDGLAEDYTPDSDVELPLDCSVDTAQPMWVHCGSCFVAVVGKLPAGSGQDEGEYVWGRLGAALRSWRPNLYRLILSEIQNALELEAVAHHENWLHDDLALGLGLYLMESEGAASGSMSPTDIEGAAQSLIDRFVDIIRQRLASHPKISSTAADLLGLRLSTALGQLEPNENARHARARELAHVPRSRNVDWRAKVLPSVNAFMVSDAFRGSHITTGTVLRGPDAGYWLCASPACDLVPREQGPLLVQLMRLQPTTDPPTRFSPGEFVVIGDGDQVRILRALAEKARQPSLTTLVLPSGTRVQRGSVQSTAMISGWIATDVRLRAASVVHGFPLSAPADSTGQTAPVQEQVSAEHTEPAQFEILSQLRSAFATRFLMAAGHHQSRIGVDFVDL